MSAQLVVVIMEENPMSDSWEGFVFKPMSDSWDCLHHFSHESLMGRIYVSLKWRKFPKSQSFTIHENNYMIVLFIKEENPI